MELLEGRDLRQILNEKLILPVPIALSIAKQLLRALAYAHGKGVLHRDLKPGNVIVSLPEDDEPVVKVLDFGLAKVAQGDVTSTPLTVKGTAFGTPGYVAPEVLAARPADARADVFAVGVMLYEMIVGKRPFAAETRVQELRATLTAPIPPLTPDVEHHAELDAILELALAREPTKRFADSAAMLAALDPIGAPPRMSIAAKPAATEPEKPRAWHDAMVPLPMVMMIAGVPLLAAILLAIALLFTIWMH
jgi:serine/threonine-protein kinase